jgi:hypothetical protein
MFSPKTELKRYTAAWRDFTSRDGGELLTEDGQRGDAPASPRAPVPDQGFSLENADTGFRTLGEVGAHVAKLNGLKRVAD